MLVLQRRVGEDIMIGDQVRVRVSAVQGRSVRIAIDAPRSITIRRAEIEPFFQDVDSLDDQRQERPPPLAAAVIRRNEVMAKWATQRSVCVVDDTGLATKQP